MTLLPPAQAHSPTSRAAAESMAHGAAPRRALVYRSLLQRGPATDEELQTRTGLPPSTQRPRRIELCDLGLVQDSGHQRLTRSGRWAIVWEVTRGEPAQLPLLS